MKKYHFLEPTTALRAGGHWQDEDPGRDGRKGDTPEYVLQMQQELFEVLAEAKMPGAQRTVEAYS